MAYTHRRRRRRRGQKGGILPLLPLISALAPAVIGPLASGLIQGGRGRIRARRYREDIEPGLNEKK